MNHQDGGLCGRVDVDITYSIAEQEVSSCMPNTKASGLTQRQIDDLVRAARRRLTVRGVLRVLSWIEVVLCVGDLECRQEGDEEGQLGVHFGSSSGATPGGKKLM